MLDEILQNIEFTDLLDIEVIQEFQDSFSDATGVASIITKPNGTPITKASNFCNLCVLIRKTEKGLNNCYHSDAVLGRQHQGGPIFQKCLSGGLWDGGASISVNGKHIANWLIGQVINEDSDETGILNYAKEIGADEQEFKNELRNVTRMPLAQFKKIANSLYIFANQLSEKAYQNLQLKLHQEGLEILVDEKTKELGTAIEELKSTNEELCIKNEIIVSQNTKLKETLQELKQTQSKLIQSEKMASLGVLTAGVAHEINNPLNFLMGAYHGFKAYFENTEVDNKEITTPLLESIKLGIDRISGITKGLSKFSRDDSGYNETCNVESIIDNCLMILQNQLKHKVIISKKYFLQEITIKGNVGKLHQLFTNIIVNASQAINNSGEIIIETAKSENIISIKISDNGVGIKKELIPKVTDPFFTTKSPGEGTGLGLSICYSIVKEHSGELLVESTENVGTAITVKLPLTYENADGTGTARANNKDT